MYFSACRVTKTFMTKSSVYIDSHFPNLSKRQRFTSIFGLSVLGVVCLILLDWRDGGQTGEQIEVICLPHKGRCHWNRVQWTGGLALSEDESNHVLPVLLRPSLSFSHFQPLSPFSLFSLTLSLSLSLSLHSLSLDL